MLILLQDRGELFTKDENGKFYYSDVDYLETWKGMEALVNKGLTKAIGLSNFNSKQIQRVLDSCNIKPVMLQVIFVRYFCIFERMEEKFLPMHI